MVLAHELWRHLVLPHDLVIDATAGNGRDTLMLAQLVTEGKVIAFDIQEEAIMKTHQRLKEADLLHRVELYTQSHETFPLVLNIQSIRLIVYNLGYLPGSDKQIKTNATTSLLSLKAALPLIMPGGAISMTFYPGHNEGQEEQKILLNFVKELPPSEWMVTHIDWHNRSCAPSLLWIIRAFIPK